LPARRRDCRPTRRGITTIISTARPNDNTASNDPLLRRHLVLHRVDQPNDETHARAATFTASFNGSVVTTAWVLNELANFLAKPPNRALFLEMLRAIQADGRISVVPMTQEMFERGVALYGQRLDKEWSVTDCISSLVMKEQGLTDALTSDHHFEQAGFNVLLK
jgi:predicted nucleic acid-binding protein